MSANFVSSFRPTLYSVDDGGKKAVENLAATSRSRAVKVNDNRLLR